MKLLTLTLLFPADFAGVRGRVEEVVGLGRVAVEVRQEVVHGLRLDDLVRLGGVVRQGTQDLTKELPHPADRRLLVLLTGRSGHLDDLSG